MKNREQVRMAVTVRGFVQGVGFRWWTKRLADSLGVTGMVWNRRDGSVGACAQGDVEAVNSFVDLLSRGPHNASVHSVETRIVPCIDNSRSFEITFDREEA